MSCEALRSVLLFVAVLFTYRLLYDTFTLSILQLATEDTDMFRCRYVFTQQIVNHNACAVYGVLCVRS